MAVFFSVFKSLDVYDSFDKIYVGADNAFTILHTRSTFILYISIYF